MAINQNDYHYWEGSFKGLLPNEILKLSDEDFQTLYEEFIEAKICIFYLRDYMDKGYPEGKGLRQIFKNFLSDINSDYLNYFNTAKEIDLFRSLSVNKIEEISFDDKGICWTYNTETLSNHIERIIVPHNKYLTRFYGTTPIDNIDWIESFFLYINYSALEKELRIYDSQKVFLKGYVNINYSTMIEYSKGGEILGLLDRVITKESLLKEKESLLKDLLYNPQTNRYDYNGSLDKDVLSTFVSEDKDGFTINFGKITGYFNCSNLDLVSLKGAPTEIGGDFRCGSNQLTSLEGAPQKVGGSFYCDINQLTSLEGAPIEVGESFICSYNQLTSLKGAPQIVDGSFWCENNQLTSLEGAPQKVGGNLNCKNNYLTSLEGAPQKVGGDFNCSNNKLTSLKGAPQKVGGGFFCSNNQLTSLKGAPQEIGSSFDCSNNKLTSLKGAPKTVYDWFNCKNNQLTSLEGAPRIIGEFYWDNNLNL